MVRKPAPCVWRSRKPGAEACPGHQTYFYIYIYIYILESSCALRAHLILMYPNQVWALASSYFDGAMIHQKGTWDLCKFHITPICAWQDCSSKQIRNARHIRTSTQMDTQKRMRRSLHTSSHTPTNSLTDTHTHMHTHTHTYWTLQRDPPNLQKRCANVQQDPPKRRK